MTREEAVSYDNELKDKLMLAAKRMGLAENIGSDIVDGCIMVIPDDNRKGMIFLGKESASYKVGNIRMDLKKAIVAGLELVASASIPGDFFNYLQLLIVGVLFIQKAVRQGIEKEGAYLVYFLHLKNAYMEGVREESLLSDFQRWYRDRTEKFLELAEIREIVEELWRQKILDVIEGKIYLAEYVRGSV